MTASTVLSPPIAPPALDELCINTLRFLAVDMMQKANSGHPGLPLGSAATAYTLWDRLLKFNPRDPLWPDRDRFSTRLGTGRDLPCRSLQRRRAAPSPSGKGASAGTAELDEKLSHRTTARLDGAGKELASQDGVRRCGGPYPTV